MHASSTSATAATVIRNVRIFDGHHTIAADSVLVADGHISAVGTNLVAPSRVTVVDGAGGTCCPG